MQLFLTFLLIILFNILGLYHCENVIKDFSDDCQNGKKIFVYLTTGMGHSDAHNALVASVSHLNCTLKYYVKTGHSVMVVVEFPDKKPNETVCVNTNNTVNMVSEDKKRNLCSKVHRRKKSIFRTMAVNLVNLELSGNEFNTIRVTATSLRDPKNQTCAENEITCLYKKKIMCMHSVVSCDGFNNCGMVNRYDEDLGFCQKTTLTPKIIIWSVIIFSVLFWLSVSVTFSIMTKRKETFVYKFDDTMFIFGTEKSYSNIDIQIQTILPVKKKVGDIKSRIKKKVFKGKRKIPAS